MHLKEKSEKFLFFILGLGWGFFLSSDVSGWYKSCKQISCIFQHSQIPPPDTLSGPLPSAPPEQGKVPHLKAWQVLFFPAPAMAQGCWGHGLGHPPWQAKAGPTTSRGSEGRQPQPPWPPWGQMGPAVREAGTATGPPWCQHLCPSLAQQGWCHEAGKALPSWVLCLPPGKRSPAPATVCRNGPHYMNFSINSVTEENTGNLASARTQPGV